MTHGNRFVAVALAALALVALAAAQQDGEREKREAELARVRELADELLPKVAEITGLAMIDEVKIEVTTKAEVREFLIKLLDEEFPGDKLERQARCLATLGLLPAGYDLRAGLIDILHEQAGAFYDPRTKTFYSIIDLPKELKLPLFERLIVAHELTHALQDGAVDLLKMQQADKDNGDLNFAHMAIVEGMATLAMFQVVQGVDAGRLPDLGGMMRLQMGAAASNPMMKVFAASPKYLQESLIGPYADGASFVQAYLKANAEIKTGSLMSGLPVSSEQILHYDKYVDGDLPTAVDLSGAGALLPEGWQPYYGDVLGEFDVRVLCGLYEPTKEKAREIAAGWDGIYYSSFAAGERLLLIGASVWDSEKDAEEFAEGLKLVLEEVNEPGEVLVKRRGVLVNFIIGRIGEEERRRLMEALAASGPPGEAVEH